jgi:hypothetical protein
VLTTVFKTAQEALNEFDPAIERFCGWARTPGLLIILRNESGHRKQFAGAGTAQNIRAGASMDSNELSARDRRQAWKITSRPEWVTQFNALGPKLDKTGIVPLDEESLTAAARRNTGLDDFDEDGWRDHFRVLLEAIESEADLHFFGRILTRSDILAYLEARLQIVDLYKRHPEIDDEVITEPVFILGFGRSGTTILHETLSQDPQFRSVRRWEALFPSPPPEEASYETDPRIEKAQGRVDVVHALCPEWPSMHAWGGALPVEDIEFTYVAFFSEVWATAMQIPAYEKYFNSQDPAYHFHWHKRVLKLLQWKYRKPHWLLKNPTHMPRIPQLLQAYPDAKIILPHRDPIATADSVVNVGGAIFSWRTDNPYGTRSTGDEWIATDWRVKMWDDVIEWIEDGTLRNGFFANSIYAQFMAEPEAALRALYHDLQLTLIPEALDRMLQFLATRHGSSHGNKSRYEKSRPDDPRTVEERKRYARYQQYFGVPDEL